MKNNWISVEDRLPELLHEDTANHIMVSRTCLISDGRTQDVGHYTENNEWKPYNLYGYMFREDVTHWQPLPPPPSEI